jgi:hypothetical protein
MLTNVNHHVKITRGTSPDSGLAITRRAETGAVIDSGRNFKLDSRPFLRPAVTAALTARTLDHLSGSMTTRTGLRYLEKPAGGNDLAAALTGWTGHCARAGFCSRPTAMGASFMLQDFDLLLGPERGFLQSDLQIVP